LFPKLQVLQDSLCGSSKVLLVCNLSPETDAVSETLSSLNFASRAAQVELGPAKKASGSGAAGALPCVVERLGPGVRARDWNDYPVCGCRMRTKGPILPCQ
jgi:kinesin family member C2/C3